MKDYESGFLALIMTGILMMVIGLGLTGSAGRSPGDSALERRTRPPVSALVMRLPESGSPAVRVR